MLVVIALENIDAGQLPSEVAISASTMADVKIAYNEPKPPSTRRRLMATLAGAYGRIYTAVIATRRAGRRGGRPVNRRHGPSRQPPPYTRNVGGFRGMEHLLTIVGV
jgi:hypothetical protein